MNGEPKKKVYAGIDPGAAESAIALVNEQGKCLITTRLTDWNVADYKQALLLLRDKYDILLVAIERVGVMPGQGISSSGKFMKATGMIIGLLCALDIPFVEVSPQTWKKLSPDLKSNPNETPTERKKRSLNYAQKRFPEANLTKSIEHNIADALCMAEWVWLRGKTDDRL